MAVFTALIYLLRLIWVVADLRFSRKCSTLREQKLALVNGKGCFYPEKWL